jgi:hypothetical protein
MGITYQEKLNDLKTAQLTGLVPWMNGFTAPPTTFPPAMVGATIVGIGVPSEPEKNMEDGACLVIDYRPDTSGEVFRIALPFHERGMWIEFNEPLV